LKKNKTILLLIISLLPQILFSQIRVSLSTDISLQRNFKKEQRFWSFGQDVVVNWHFTPKGGAYASVTYYSNGKFNNSLSASAKSSTTLPQEIFFTNKAQVRLVQISLGWKHCLVGTNDAESKWNLYSITGFGLIFGEATNIYSTTIDTSLYNAPLQPINGNGHFKRLTLDLGLGLEVPLGGDIYFYSEGKIWIPTTGYPSKYLFVNNNAPFAAMATAGLRILF
jgi:hypothetical protein